MIKKLLLVLLTLQSASSFATFEFKDGFFYIESYQAVCTGCHSYNGSNSDTTYGINTRNYDIDVENEYLYTGNIVITESDSETSVMRVTRIEGIRLRMKAYGLIADLAGAGNQKIRIMGLSGRKIGDIFTSTFEGARVRATAILNLSQLAARNSSGIWLQDNEDLFTWGINADINYVSLRFSHKGPNTIINVTKSEENSATDKSAVNFNQVMNATLH